VDRGFKIPGQAETTGETIRGVGIPQRHGGAFMNGEDRCPTSGCMRFGARGALK